MRCHIDVQESAIRMFDDHKHIENTKRRRDRHTEVTGDYSFGLIADKR